jgi:hypothetical protein
VGVDPGTSAGAAHDPIGEASSAKNARTSFRFGPWKMIGAVVAIVLIASAAAYHFRFHAIWMYESNHHDLGDISAIPNQPMTDCPTPGDWVRCRANGIEISLPPEIAKNAVPPKKGTSMYLFGNKSRGVFFGPPDDVSLFSDLLDSADRFCPEPHRPFTMPLLRLSCYAASSSDFHWSMSPASARWHTFRIATRKLMPGSLERIEMFERAGLEGILIFERKDFAFFEWHGGDPPSQGQMHFVNNTDDPGVDWIRAVCQSLRLAK